jgi:ABC-type dipeptide/oligopeptide/nickel transport system ATPase component
MLENANQGVFQSPILSSPKEPYTRRLLAAVPENIGTELPTGSP